MAFDYMHPPEDFEYLGEWCKAWRDPATGDWTISQLLDGLETEQIILSGEEVRELARLAAQHDPTDYELEYGELHRPMFATPPKPCIGWGASDVRLLAGRGHPVRDRIGNPIALAGRQPVRRDRQLGVEEGALRPVEEGLDRRGLRRGFKGMDHPPRRGTPGGRVDPVRRIPDAPVLRLDDPHRPRPQE